MKFLFWQIIILGFFILQIGNESNDIVRLNPPSIQGEVAYSVPHVIDFKDTIPNDTLWEYRDAQKTPLMYSRNIYTGVCIDGECRMVRIKLFWNITGRYMGFKLPEGEFLSKTKHVPFISSDYDRLHVLLADPLSALAYYSINELVPVKDSTKSKEVDAVSSATISAVLDYIVKGAVYTTYTLWHITYGQTKREIEAITSAELNSDLVLRLLDSQKLEDKVWALNNISPKMQISGQLLDVLLLLVSSDDVYLAERSLNAMNENLLTKNVQVKLSEIFIETGFLQKKLIIQKLNETREIEDVVIENIATDMSNMNASLIKNVLELFSSHNIQKDVVVEQVSELLKNENRYISSQAMKYLESLNNLDSKTKKELEKYRRKTG